MKPADEIRAARDRAQADLDEAHDYYYDTTTAWGIVQVAVASGLVAETANVLTGTTTTDAQLVLKAQKYVDVHILESTFQQFLSIFEEFLFELIRVWLTAYPRNLAGKKLDFKAVLELEDRDAIIQSVIRRELNELAYERPAAWFAYLEERTRLGVPTPDQIARIAEAKAARDVLVHGRGIVTATYVSKSGALARYAAGDRIDITGPYHRATWGLLGEVVGAMGDAAVGKLD